MWSEKICSNVHTFEEKLKLLQPYDEQLYARALEKFEAQIDEFGREKINKYVEELQRLSQLASDFCVENPLHPECILMSLNTFSSVKAALKLKRLF